MLALQLPKELEDRLEALAKATGKTKELYAQEAILTHLEDLEDYYIGAQAYAEYKASGEQAISLEQVRKNLGLED